ncbi:hypothetical protein JBL43_19895 [Aureibaculum sp. A20]|uniref:Uncharacterized protein n=1 Tax=Aureibaculum flavum TaxID=2795986 RepID=A0ABS0WX02_9FLAO|nr:hypothetical protein [Aureibaculum flavum]MBJ2176521.1 hypothetical protein [Aureibaculum flavum]
MKNLLKRLLFTFIGISILGILMYNISFWNQERNFEKFAYDFNPKRNEIGLQEISKNWKSKKRTWENWKELNDENYNDGKISKFKKIFSLKNITTGMIFETGSTDKKTNLRSKLIWLNSNILFWKNGIESEMDVYERDLDSLTIENLLIRYYFKDDNGNKDYFEVDYYQTNVNEFYFCGTPAIMEREEQRISGKPYFGNITKKQADSILNKWDKSN